MKKKNYLNPQFITKISDDGTLNVESLIILTCAIFIASIGLNVNSTATIIGAMLISPLMGPLLAVGTGLALYNTRILRKGAISLAAEIIISLLASTIYFHFSPLTYASQEIVARTSPTIWDVMIAFFGGSAGIIGARKKGANNIVPGVAIATALMPPLCTVGYSIASGNLKYFIGSSYLFLINCVFITLTAFLGVKIMKWLSHSAGQPGLSFFRKPTKTEIGIVLIVIILIVPSIISARSMVNHSMIDQNVQQMVTEKFGNVDLIKEDVDTKEKTINLTVSGKKISSQKIQDAKQSLGQYHMKGYSLNIVQVAQVQNTETQLTRQVNTILNQRQQEREDESERRQEQQEKRNNKIKEMAPEIASVTSVSDNKDKQIVLIDLKKDLSKKKRKKLVKQIKTKYDSINVVEFTLTDARG